MLKKKKKVNCLTLFTLLYHPMKIYITVSYYYNQKKARQAATQVKDLREEKPRARGVGELVFLQVKTHTHIHTHTHTHTHTQIPGGQPRNGNTAQNINTMHHSLCF